MADAGLSASAPWANLSWERRGAAWAVGGLSAALIVVTSAWAVWQSAARQAAPAWAVGASAVLAAALLAVALSAGGVRAMLFQTFSQCLRMKVAAAFAVVLGACLAWLPSVMTGDGTLAGAIRALLAYGVSVTAFVLSLLMVILSTYVVSKDVERKTIFLTSTKPLARWQYVVGRWLGVTALGGALLVGAMGAVFAWAQHLRRQPERMTGEDRRVVETEIFAARGKVFPDPVNLDQRVREKIDRLRQQNQYEDAVESYKARFGGDTVRAEKALEEEIRKQVETEVYSADPLRGLFWTFSGIHVAGGQRQFSGVVQSVDREELRVRIQADPEWASRMIYQMPVHIEEVDGRVVESGGDFLVVQFYSPENLLRLGPDNLSGRPVLVTIDPPIQLTYKAVASGDLPDRIMSAQWVLQNPSTQAQQMELRRDPEDRPATLTASSRIVSPDGRLYAYFYNRSPASLRIDPTKDIYVLYAEDSFEANYARAVLLILLQLAFLAALGVLAGTFLSFPVAVLLSLTFLGIAVLRWFIVDAVMVSSIFAPGVDALTALGYLAMRFLSILLPDFQSTWPSDTLVDGLNIPWSSLGQTACLTVGVRTLTLLAVGCLIHRHRELARVQV